MEKNNTKIPTIDDVFDATDVNCDHSGDSVAYQAWDRVFMVDLGTEEYNSNGDIIAFDGWEVAIKDVSWDERLEEWVVDDCGPLCHVTLTEDGHVNTTSNMEE